MNNNILKNLKFSLDLVNIFNAYVTNLENYFSVDENKLKNVELFNLYINLQTNIFNLYERYGLKK